MEPLSLATAAGASLGIYSTGAHELPEQAIAAAALPKLKAHHHTMGQCCVQCSASTPRLNVLYDTGSLCSATHTLPCGMPHHYDPCVIVMRSLPPG
jgi:hypothetical protein